MNRPWQLALAVGVTLLGSGSISHAAEFGPVEAEPDIERTGSSTSPIRWTPVQEEPSTTSQQPQWKELTDDPEHLLPESVVWTPVEPSVAADIEEKIEDHHKIEDLESRVASLEDRVEELLQALRDKGGNPTLAKEIENL